MGICVSSAGRPQLTNDPSAPSGALQPGTFSHRLTIGNINKHIFASLVLRTPWTQPAQLVLANKSGYNVSYWVIQEDKLRAKARREHVAKSMGAHFEVGSTGGSVTADMDRAEENTTEMDIVDHVVTRDHRMGSNGATQPTKIRFPENCKALRVYGYFKRDDGAWISYKEKDYSIGRFHSDFYITALDCSIAPYLGTASSAGQE